MANVSDYICGTQQQIQAVYDWLKQLNRQSFDWVLAVDDIREAKKADRATRIAVWREAAMRVQRMFEVLQETDVLWEVLQPCIWDETAEIWHQASDTCVAIRRACARGQYSTREFVAWSEAHNAFKDLLDTLLEALEIALEQTEAASGIAGDGAETPMLAREAQPDNPKWTLDERALAFFLADKNRTKTMIAKLLGVSTQSICPSRCPQLDNAMRAWQEANTSGKIRGRKDKDGNLEAWEEDE